MDGERPLGQIIEGTPEFARYLRSKPDAAARGDGGAAIATAEEPGGNLADGLAREASETELRDAIKAGALGFYARLFVQAGLPHMDPKTDRYERSNGSLRLRLVAVGADGLPYGSMPRLLLAWVTTEAKRTNKRRLLLGNTLRSFMDQLDLAPRGGQRGEITRLRNQMRRLFGASVSCVYEGSGGWAMANVNIAESAELWWDPKQPDQMDLWNSHVVLGERFFEEIITRPVPIDTRALRALRRSPLAIDLYVWLTYRMSYLTEPTTVPWSLLALQTGAHYSEMRQFRRRATEALTKVLVVYPDARVQAVVDHRGQPVGLRLQPSPTHVTKKPLPV